MPSAAHKGGAQVVMPSRKQRLLVCSHGLDDRCDTTHPLTPFAGQRDRTRGVEALILSRPPIMLNVA